MKHLPDFLIFVSLISVEQTIFCVSGVFYNKQGWNHEKVINSYFGHLIAGIDFCIMRVRKKIQ